MTAHPTFIIVLCGLPGCGKTTIANYLQSADGLAKFSARLGHPVATRVVSYDPVFLERLQQHNIDKDSWNPTIWHEAREICFATVTSLCLSTPKALLTSTVEFWSPNELNCSRIIIVDDNFYYRSMRHAYYHLARQGTPRKSTKPCESGLICDIRTSQICSHSYRYESRNLS